MKNKALIEEIKKLLALSKSTNAHEVALAMERAQEMMKKYELSLSAIEFSAINQSRSWSPSDAETIPGYVTSLACAIEAAFGVFHVYG